MNSFLSSRPAGVADKPKAHLNWILFDEQFQYVAGGSGADAVGSNQEFKIHALTGLPVTKNGYIYVYVSNETPNINVFFDNLQITHVRGPLLEENHYYPFRLTISALSAKASGKPENKFKYNGKEFESDFDLNAYDYGASIYDAQIGRWQANP